MSSETLHDGDGVDMDRYGKSATSDQWYRVTEWEDVGEGKMVAVSKEPVDEDEVPAAFKGAITWSLEEESI